MAAPVLNVMSGECERGIGCRAFCARHVAVAAFLLMALLLPLRLSAIDASDRYRSPRNPERKIRKSTELIVLHTTEAPARSSLNKVSDRGECHYVVTEEGRVYRIVDRDREAFHAGRSMWNGKEDVDKFSIGIECVGHHDKSMSSVQLAAIRTLVKELQAMYSLPDHCVVCHSHVAYGAPNKWHKRKHRGRKRCGMLFAMPSVRQKLGLKTRPARDSDTRSGRLAVGDGYLNRVLYGNVDTMRSQGVAANPAKSSSPAIFRWFADKGGAQKKVQKVPPGATQANVKKPPAKPAAASAAPKSVAELKARGYRMRGCVSQSNPAGRIAGKLWNHAETFYAIRGKVIPGNKINPARIERGMEVWMK